MASGDLVRRFMIYAYIYVNVGTWNLHRSYHDLASRIYMLIVMEHVDGLVHCCSMSIAKALELLQFCTKPLNPLLMHWSDYSLLISHRYDEYGSTQMSTYIYTHIHPFKKKLILVKLNNKKSQQPLTVVYYNRSSVWPLQLQFSDAFIAVLITVVEVLWNVMQVTLQEALLWQI